MLNVTVIDAQGGGLGAAIVKSLCERYGESIHILALGTNVIGNVRHEEERRKRLCNRRKTQ